MIELEKKESIYHLCMNAGENRWNTTFVRQFAEALDEIEKDFGVRPKNLHRPFIDELIRPNPDDPTGKSKMVRVEEVFDCWFESGSMPYAQDHYPFENKQSFEKNYLQQYLHYIQKMTALSLIYFSISLLILRLEPILL